MHYGLSYCVVYLIFHRIALEVLFIVMVAIRVSKMVLFRGTDELQWGVSDVRGRVGGDDDDGGAGGGGGGGVVPRELAMQCSKRTRWCHFYYTPPCTQSCLLLPVYYNVYYT